MKNCMKPSNKEETLLWVDKHNGIFFKTESEQIVWDGLGNPVPFLKGNIQKRGRANKAPQLKRLFSLEKLPVFTLLTNFMKERLFAFLLGIGFPVGIFASERHISTQRTYQRIALSGTWRVFFSHFSKLTIIFSSKLIRLTYNRVDDPSMPLYEGMGKILSR